MSLAFAEKFPEILESLTLFFSTTLQMTKKKANPKKKHCRD
jgi:hypothetical protein